MSEQEKKVSPPFNSTPLEKHIFDLVEKSLDGEDDQKRPNAVHATTIAGECVRRPWYEFTEAPRPYSKETKRIFKMGTIVHDAVILNKEGNEISVAANIRTMKPIKPKAINAINFFDCVSGRIDDVIEFQGEKVIADKKTWSSVKRWNPDKIDDNYIFQLNEYALLYHINHPEEKPIETGVIAYIDVATRFKEIRVFEIELWDMEVIREKVLAKLDLLKSTTAPPRVITWKCKFCPWVDICKPEQDPNFEELINKK